MFFQVMARIVHPRVVALLGAFIPRDFRKGQQLKIVMELFGKDDIEKVLLDSKTKDQIPLYERVKWMKQVAEGMAWIHGAGIVHRDLKPSNILFDAKTRSVKVCDFGLSVLLPKGHKTNLDPKGTPLYVAPELVTEGPTTHACDVFSFGILGYAFVSRQRPYDNRPDLPEDISEFLGCVVEGTRPWMEGTAYDFPASEEECPVSLKRLLKACWDGDFHLRPTFEQVIDQLDYVLVDTACPLSMTGRTFWKRSFVDAKEVLVEDAPWNEFQKSMWKTFASQEDSVEPHQQEIAIKCLRELFAVTKNKEEVVPLDHYGRVLGFLPSLKKGFFAALVDLCRQPWFWGATDPKQAYKQLVPAKSRSYMVRFSSTPPNFTISFKEKTGNVLHRRVMRKYGESAVQFENGDMCDRAVEPFKSLPHMVEEMQIIMKWKALQGGPFWWIFNEKNAGGGGMGGGYAGGYGGFVQAEYEDEDDDETVKADGKQAKDAPPPEKQQVQKKVTEADIAVMKRIRFLGRSGMITEVKGSKVQVLFRDNERKEWVKRAGLLERAYIESDTF